MSLGVKSDPPQSIGTDLYVIKFGHCLHIVFVIVKYTDIFWGKGGRLGMISTGRILVGEVDFRGG